MSHAGFVFAAFAIAWLVLFAYSLYLNRNVAELRDELEALKARDQDEPSP